MNQLNHSAVELSGINLIEASAGTGKTYAIASLYLRLLLEKELLPEQILVVTYTEAATQELRGRIRSRIREALEVMGGRDSSDAFLEELYDKASRSGMKRVRDLLERALGAFDTASIFTIHGFCLRALQDNAFESGSLYDTELVTDQTELLRDIVDDFWRVHFFGESTLLLGYALRNRLTPETFLSLLKNLHTGTGVEIIPDFNDDQIAELDRECGAAYSECRSIWREHKESIIELLSTDKGLSRAVKYYKAELLEPLFAGMDAFVDGGNPYDLFDAFSKLTCDGIAEGTKSKGVAPSHPLFASCQRLHDAVDRRFLALKSELVHFYQKNLPLRKQAGNVRFFDDLLEDLYRALLSDGGGEILAGLLRAKYLAALIDEFQDTDPVQYEIFRSIYAGSDLPLFLIGDPKQAIYSFRGADIFAYMRAALDVREERRFTLTDNWRSAPLLLQAFNTLFDNCLSPSRYGEEGAGQYGSIRERY
jgi:exodeoxyribonuclease V beta subunit